MELTEKQKDINADPLYWEWYVKWWEKDYSVSNLSNHFAPDGTSLEDLYNLPKVDKYYLTEFGDRSWHPLHAPRHDLEGNVNPSLGHSFQYFQRNRFEPNNNLVVGTTRDDIRFNSRYNYVDCHLPICLTDQTTPLETTDCLWSFSNNKNINIAGKHLGLFLLTPAKTWDSVCLKKSNIGENVVSVSGRDSKHEFINCDFKARVNFTAKKVDLVKCRGSSFVFRVRSDFDLDFVGVANQNQEIILNNYATSRQAISLGLSNAKRTKVFATGLKVTKWALADSGLSELVLEDCILACEIVAIEKQFGEIRFSNCVFAKGMNFSKTIFSGHFLAEGIRSTSTTNFSESIFNCSAAFEDFLDADGALLNTSVKNADFSSTKFKQVNSSNHDTTYCAKFNDVEFVGSANFQKVEFDGVPKFHGAKIHSETSFRGFIKPQDFKRLKSISNEKLHEYQSAFRSLRQHMETISSYSEAFEFGRLEMRAKQHRDDTDSVPKIVARATRIYEFLADYGQSFSRPVYLLFGVWFISLLLQFASFAVTHDWCLLMTEGCSLEQGVISKILARSSLFAIPPFTLFTERAIGLNTEGVANDWANVLSGAFMVLHGLCSSLLIFLTALALRRRLQMR